jgi:uncharacterized heparinase superfamily protein
MLPPFDLSPSDAAARTASTRQWLASLAVPPAVRASLNSAIDAIADGNRRAVATALASIVDVAGPQLDVGSANELKELASDLSAQRS